MPIKNYTTKVGIMPTVTSLMTMLGKAGAEKVLLDYEDGLPVAISFMLKINRRPIYFRLPGRVDGVRKTLEKQRVSARFRTREHAARVGWRIVKDWVAAQLAIVEAEIAELPEVFLPYADAGGGQNLYDRMKSDPGTILNLPDGEA